MKKIWKVIWIIVIVMCVAGVACGAAAWFMGGRPEALYDNSAAAPVLQMFDPYTIWNNICSFIGF